MIVPRSNPNALSPKRSNRNRFRLRSPHDDQQHQQPQQPTTTDAWRREGDALPDAAAAGRWGGSRRVGPDFFGMVSADMPTASIPLPKSHIRRTPSEIQIANATKQAEYDDVRMFSRLVSGIQSQCRHSSVVHPLTTRSLQTMTQTAMDEDLERLAEEDDGWGFAHDIQAAARMEMEAEYQHQNEKSMETSDHDRDSEKAPNPFTSFVKAPTRPPAPKEEATGMQEKKDEEYDDIFSLDL